MKTKGYGFLLGLASIGFIALWFKYPSGTGQFISSAGQVLGPMVHLLAKGLGYMAHLGRGLLARYGSK